jgi:hypothetical protein
MWLNVSVIAVMTVFVSYCISAILAIMKVTGLLYAGWWFVAAPMIIVHAIVPIVALCVLLAYLFFAWSIWGRN